MNYAFPMPSRLDPCPSASTTPIYKPSEGTALAVLAKRVYAMCRERDAVFGTAMFSEPAWDILLDLFVSEHDGRQLSVSSVCIGARAPSATALRYLKMLEENALVERIRDMSDGRRSHVRLTMRGRRHMTRLLSMLA